jgi:FkbM family methyltransferase
VAGIPNVFLALRSRILRGGFGVLASLSRRFPSFVGKEPALRFASWRFRNELEAVRCTVLGTSFEVDVSDLIDFRLYFLGSHDRHVLQHVGAALSTRARADGSPVFWDVGANVGTIALPVAAAFPHVIVHAFEPSPGVFRRLERNLGLNPTLQDRVRLHQIALSDSDSVVDFFPSRETSNSGCGSLFAMHNTWTTPVPVEARTGDHVVAEDRAAVPDVIKIDVEGFEYEVLLGISGLLASHRPLSIVVEHSPYRLQARGVPLDRVVNLLDSLGFQIAGLRLNGHTVPLTVDFLRSEHDLLARR